MRKLPKIDSYKVCHMLKSDDKYKTIPIILLTACAQKNDEKIGLQCGADAYVVKSFEPNVLLGEIKKFIK